MFKSLCLFIEELGIKVKNKKLKKNRGLQCVKVLIVRHGSCVVNVKVEIRESRDIKVYEEFDQLYSTERSISFLLTGYDFE